ncbi:hypothetical protein Q7L71_28585, partial [Conexibacter sp. CPCC 205706]
MAIEHPPPLPRALVHRTRLLDRLDDGTRAPLTVVSGPAGAGKTTLLADWARGRGAARSPSWRDGSRAPAALLETLGRERTRDGDPLVVVIDGLDAGSTPAVFGERLTTLLRDRGERLRIVLACRGEPPLPLGRARLDATVVEIAPRELAFTWEEARALLATRLPDAAARERWQAVEGWAAGLEREPAERNEYVRRELLDRLGEQERALLLRLAVVDEPVTPELAAALAVAAVGGRAAAAGVVLERLARAHALVVPLDRHGGSYRLAAPLRDALRPLLPHDERPPLHRRTAGWHARAGNPEPRLVAGSPDDDLATRRRQRTLALRQLGVAQLAAGDVDDAAATLEQALGSARSAGLDHLAVACLGPLATLDAGRGRLRSAQAWGEQALVLAADLGDERSAALVPAHTGLAVVAWQRDRRCAADAELRRAEALLAASDHSIADDAATPPTTANRRSADDARPPLAARDRRGATPPAAGAFDPLVALTLRLPAAWLAAAGPP